MKTKKMLAAAGLLSVAAISLASCSGEEKAVTKYDDSTVYNDILGNFYSSYTTAKSEIENTSLRYAEMAIAEAKLLESGVMMPTTSNGGRYAISRMAPYTTDYAKAGNDDVRYHQALITTEGIKNTDRTTMKQKWVELQGSGTYEVWAKNYLETHGYTLKDTYSMAYSSDVQTWDALNTSRSTDSDAIVNTYDGLVEYDVEGTLKGALAESWSVSADGLTYTFKLRQGVKWVNSQNIEQAEVTADDFVAGFQHMLDSKAGLEYLVEGLITGASEYISGKGTIDDVGVKAVDNYTVQYTLTQKTSYFMSMLGYGVFAPMNRAYYQSKGGKFGSNFNSTSADYKYGKDTDSILYCGPYVVTNNTQESKIVFSSNNSYYNKDNINVKTITWLYNDGTDVTKAYTDYKNGTIDGVSLTTATLETAKSDGLVDTYVYTGSTGTASYMMFYNLNRLSYKNTNDNTGAASYKTYEQKEATKTAMLNQHFRLAISYSFDRENYNAQKVGSGVALASLRNTYTPGDFVSLSEDVTISINGKSTTFKAGTYYGAILQAQLTADGSTIKAWDSTKEEGKGSSDGYDGWYNVEEAVKELDLAISELASLNISKDNPIYIDYPYYSSSATYVNMANAYKQSIESALGGKVIVNLVECKTASDWYYAGYYCETGAEANYDCYDLAGWSPDYQDPSTYLDTFLPDGAGYMVKCVGLF